MRQADRTFRITPWPQTPIPVPAVRPTDFARHGDARVVRSSITSNGALTKLTDLPDEMYLRELRPDDEWDDASIERFVATYGPLRVPSGDVSAPFLHSMLDVNAAEGFSESANLAALKRIAQESSAAKASAQKEGRHFLQTTSEFLLAVDWIHDLTEIARLYSHADPDALEAGPDTWRSGAVIARPDNRPDSLRALAGGLTAAVKGAHPRVVVTITAREHNLEQERFGALRPPLFELLGLQLFNDVVEALRYRNCDDCGQLYIRQRGRAKSGTKRRFGTLYCSDKCAQRHARQAHRDRQRQQAAAEADHTNDGSAQ